MIGGGNIYIYIYILDRGLGKQRDRNIANRIIKYNEK